VKQSCIALSISSQLELWFGIHMLYARPDPPAILLNTLLQKIGMFRMGDRFLFFISDTCHFKSTSLICVTSEHLVGRVVARSVRGRISQFAQRERRTPESMPSTPQRIVVGLASLDVTHPVNAGTHATVLLHRILNGLGAQVVEDGSIGPASVQALNGLDQLPVYRQYKQGRIKYYKSLGQKFPQFLKGWLKRANAFPDL